MCACFYRDIGPQSIIKNQRHRVLGSDCSKNFMVRGNKKKKDGGRNKKRNEKLTFKNTRVRQREMLKDERGVMEDGIERHILN